MKKRIITICAVVLFLTALGLTLYPLISNYVNQKYASEIQTAYQELIQQTDDSVLQEAKQPRHDPAPPRLCRGKWASSPGFWESLYSP